MTRRSAVAVLPSPAPRIPARNRTGRGAGKRGAGNEPTPTALEVSALARLLLLGAAEARALLGGEGPAATRGGCGDAVRASPPALRELLAPLANPTAAASPDDAEARAWAASFADARAGLCALAAHLERRDVPAALGTHYTSDDLGRFLAEATVLPAWLDTLAHARPEAFGAGGTAWEILRRAPSRFLRPAARHGLDRELPPETARAVDDPRGRAEAEGTLALPRETWREVEVRRRAGVELLSALERGAVRCVDDLVERGLDAAAFARAALADLEPLDAVVAAWDALETTTVLDPACGAGAFLLASLAVLAPMREACLMRMRELAPQSASVDPAARRARALLGACAARSSARAFAIARTLSDNLHGVDVVTEAVELTRLRLAFTLVEASERPGDLDGLEALGARVRHGDALAGGAFRAAARGGAPSGTVAGGAPLAWSEAFPGVAARGGFAAVLGNPPFVEHRAVAAPLPAGYSTAAAGNLCAPFVERSLELLRPRGRLGVIVPVAAISTRRYAPLRRLLRDRCRLAVASFHDRPARLFARLEHLRLAVVLARLRGATEPARLFTTGYRRFFAAERLFLFDLTRFTDVTSVAPADVIPKLGSPAEARIFEALRRTRRAVGSYARRGGAHRIHYTRKLSWFVQVLDFVPEIRDERGGLRPPSELRFLEFDDPVVRDACLATLNSSLFYWYLAVLSDMRNLNDRELRSMPLDLDGAPPGGVLRLARLARELMASLRRGAEVRTMRYARAGALRIECIRPRGAKPILDRIDRELGALYGLGDEEIDLLVHHEEKYRMGRG